MGKSLKKCGMEKEKEKKMEEEKQKRGVDILRGMRGINGRCNECGGLLSLSPLVGFPYGS